MKNPLSLTAVSAAFIILFGCCGLSIVVRTWSFGIWTAIVSLGLLAAIAGGAAMARVTMKAPTEGLSPGQALVVLVLLGATGFGAVVFVLSRCPIGVL